MTNSADPNTSIPISLEDRRIALQQRIQRAREQTARVGQHLAADARAAERTGRSILTGWRIFKAAAITSGLIWSFNATSHLGRGRRFFTLAVSTLSTIRAMRKVNALLLPLALSRTSKGSPT